MKLNLFIKYWLPVIIYAAIITTFSSMKHPIPKAMFVLPYFDKLLHMIEYAGFGFLLIRALNSSGVKRKAYDLRVIAMIIAVLYGLSDEVYQNFVASRSTEFFDFLSDGLGAFTGQLFFRVK